MIGGYLLRELSDRESMPSVGWEAIVQNHHVKMKKLLFGTSKYDYMQPILYYSWTVGQQKDMEYNLL